jgi:hypothetical protein
MKIQWWSAILYSLLAVGYVLTPIQAKAEAELLYVSGFDLDYMESNRFFAWVEDVKYSLCEMSPFIKDMFEVESNLIEAQNIK